MDLIPKAVQLSCERILAAPLQSIENISGGDINQARLIKTESTNSEHASSTYFLKMNSLPQSLHMFETEAKGLRLLQLSKSISTPEIIGLDEVDGVAFLLLTYIPPAPKTDTFWQNFGHSLALLHRDHTHSHFGLDHHNYIGSLVQQNNYEADWVSFFVNQRISPQLKMAVDSGKMNTHHIKGFDQVFNKLNFLLPKEPACLTHGDLWSGNFLANNQEEVELIDPAVSYAHREMDMAMTYLFGGFNPIFYAAYQTTYPLDKGFADRVEIYQLYYLLVHVNLFGGSYVQSVERILQKFQ